MNEALSESPIKTELPDDCSYVRHIEPAKGPPSQQKDPSLNCRLVSKNHFKSLSFGVVYNAIDK